MDQGDGERKQSLTTEQPPKPNPSQDPGVVPQIDSSAPNDGSLTPPDADFDVATLDSLKALKMLSHAIQALCDLTGNIPPTPPVSRPESPSLRSLREDMSRTGARLSRPGTPPSFVSSEDLRGLALKDKVIGTPEATTGESMTAEAMLVSARVASSQAAQQDAVARKFYSKKPPPISINDYLLRLHRYCPMSTAVYLAAGVYISRIAIEDKSVPVTIRTVHRLLLGSLRVAMKALEDLSYPHARFSGVGGVSEKELAKLEISICYLTNFDLKVDNKMLEENTKSLLQLATKTPARFRLGLQSLRRRRSTISSSDSTVPRIV